ncbi:MAG: ATP-dependent DNA helicase RecG, partial [Bacteroidales bacterium]|nr:ATP-dependent DNA helicase RecG [Bacteroidales bacterium]
LSLMELKEKLNIASRRYVREKIVMPMLNFGLIGMADVNNPKSRHQKYYLTEKGKRFLSKHNDKI